MTRFKTVYSALVLLGLTGCVIVEPPHEPKPWPQDKTLTAEIDAAANLTFEDTRTRSLGDIASRSFLPAQVQVYLVNTVMRSLTFDADKQQVLLKLIANPYFVQEGKKAILDRLDRFAFDSARQELLQAISDRGRIPSADELRSVHQPGPRSDAIPVESTLTVEFETSYGTNL